MYVAKGKPKRDRNLQLPMLLDETHASYPNAAAEVVKGVDEKPDAGSSTAIPFVKWVGGKRSIVDHLKSKLPQRIKSYYEPFVGGGALFFEIRRSVSSAHLSDSNFDLLLSYKAIQKEPEKLLTQLRKHARAHCEEYYYKIRLRHGLEDPVEIAARFLYLNRTCYNGLYRVNKKGEFNVPVGDYANPGIVQEENIRACSLALQGNVTLTYQDFSRIEPSCDDFVYFDPPYHPTDDTSFTAYSMTDFTEKDQVRLADFAKQLHEKGVRVMLSNSNTKFIRDLYRSSVFNIDVISAPRMVNCKPNGRSPVEEVIITNY